MVRRPALWGRRHGGRRGGGGGGGGSGHGGGRQGRRSRASGEGEKSYALQHSFIPLPRPPGLLLFFLLLFLLCSMLQSASARVSPHDMKEVEKVSVSGIRRVH